VSNVRSAPLEGGKAKSKPPEIGVLSGAAIERAFVGLLYAMTALLALLSLFGTFYGMLGVPGPLAAPWLMPADAAAAPEWFGGAFVVQLVSTLAQWGARQMARHTPRWWLLYLAALGLSVYYNLVAYHAPAVALGVPWLLAAILIIAGDAVPELVVVKRRPKKDE
jgi:hypothetical protein